jgi:hypothetical protein
MQPRPTSITVISWILIVMGAISLISTTVMLNNPTVRELMGKNPIPIPLQFAISYAGLIIMIVSGSAMLKGFNWARLLYVIWSVVGFLVGIATSPVKLAMIPGLVIFLIIVFFLFRPAANAFFSPGDASPNA